MVSMSVWEIYLKLETETILHSGLGQTIHFYGSQCSTHSHTSVSWNLLLMPMSELHIVISQASRIASYQICICILTLLWLPIALTLYSVYWYSKKVVPNLC